MKKAIVGFVLAAALALSSCQSIPGLGGNIQKLCDNAVQAHAAFMIIAATGTVKQKLIDREARAWSAAQQICTDPSRYDRQAAILTVAEVYAIIVSVTRSAK